MTKEEINEVLLAEFNKIKSVQKEHQLNISYLSKEVFNYVLEYYSKENKNPDKVLWIELYTRNETPNSIRFFKQQLI
jgi:hypothetical protein